MNFLENKKLKAIIIKILKKEPFKTISKTVDDLSVDSYLVGGYVRDILLNKDEKKEDTKDTVDS